MCILSRYSHSPWHMPVCYSFVRPMFADVQAASSVSVPLFVPSFKLSLSPEFPGDNGVLLSSSLWTRRYSLTDCATYVFHFLSEHSAISRVSILGDLQNYTENGNAILTQQGLSLPLKNDISNEDKSMFVFILTAAMQVAFWGSETVKQFFC